MHFGTIYHIIRGINPAFNALTSDKAKEIATNIINNESSKVLKDINYTELVNIIKESDEKIKMLQINTIKINMLASEIAYNIQQEMSKIENSSIKLPLGIMFGSKFLSGIGPRINIQLITSGNIITNIKSEFSSVGINQTLHRIYMEAICNVQIITPYDTYEESICNQILMSEYVIVGQIPEAYYNLNGLTQNDYLDAIQ